jgi:4-nitrophenyl phosphatase
VHPLVVGKPEPILYQQALAHMGVRSQETLVIGDRLNTDIVGGVRLGLPTALMLSGIQKREDLPASPIHPDLIFEDLSALVQTWMPLER